MDQEKCKEDLSFEEALKLLEETVKKLEAGDVTLEESMELFSEGMRLSKICSDKIAAIESRIAILTGEGGQPEEAPFEVT